MTQKQYRHSKKEKRKLNGTSIAVLRHNVTMSRSYGANKPNHLTAVFCRFMYIISHYFNLLL